MQPTRLSARRAYEETAFCVTSAAAAELFKSAVCMTSDAIDIEASEVKTAEDAKEAATILAKSLSKSSTLIETGKATVGSENFVYHITAAAAKLCRGDNPDCKSRPFRAWKLGTPGHVALAFLDVQRRVLEVFDASGSTITTATSSISKLGQSESTATVSSPLMARRLQSTILLQGAVQVLFAAGLKDLHTKEKPLNVRFVNTIFLQKEDSYCQTYIYWYIYQRALVGEPWPRVVETLQKMHPKARFDLLTKFWDYLSRSGGHRLPSIGARWRNSQPAPVPPARRVVMSLDAFNRAPRVTSGCACTNGA